MYADWRDAAPSEIKNALDAIELATVATPEDDGKSRLRYSHAGVSGLRRLVIGWNINRRLLDLAYLVTAIEHCHHGGALDFFYSSRTFTERSRFRDAVADICNSTTYRMDERGLVISYPAERVLWWNRDVLILPPLFELLWVIDPNQVKQACVELRTDIDTDGVNKVAKGWQSCMYGWLRRMTEAGPEEDPWAALTKTRARHFEKLVTWLREDAVKGDVSDSKAPLSDLLDDDRVLRFWCDRCEDSSGDYRSFAHVADLGLHLWAAIDESLAERIPHRPIDQDDRRAVREESLQPADVDPGTDFVSPLHAFDEPPLCNVKFLKKTQRRFLDPIMASGAAARHLPLTMLRAEVFGRFQTRLGRLAKSDSNGFRNLLERLDPQVEPQYETWAEKLKCIRADIHAVRNACLHILVVGKTPAAVSRIYVALPGLTLWASQQRQTIRHGGHNADWYVTCVAAAFYEELDNQDVDESLRRFLEQVAAAFGKINTDGFKNLKEALARTHIYADGYDRLERVVAVIDRFLAALEPRSCLKRQFSLDVVQFKSTFARIYNNHRIEEVPHE